MSNYYRITDPLDVRDLADQIAVWTAAGNPKANDWAEQPAAPTPNAVWTADAEWAVPAAPTYTAETWLTAQSYTPLRLLTCLDLEAKLAAASKSSPKLAAVRQWLDGITLLAAPDPDAQRTAAEWGAAPPWSFEEVVGEAVQSLQQNPET